MSKKSCCNRKCGMIALGVVGLIFVILGAIIVAVYDLIFVDIVKQETLIAPGTTMYEQWEVVTTPTFMSYYFYNITNSQEMLEAFHPRFGKAEWIKPHMEELGPYTFREYLSKDNISFLDSLDPEQVFYRQKATLIFDPEMSVGSLSDKIYTLNFLAASMPPILKHINENLNGTVLDPLYRRTDTKILFEKNVEELLFGFTDPLLDAVGNLLNVTLSLTGHATIDQRLTFGLFSTSNNSAGWFDYQVYTGRKHVELTNIITTYKGMTELDYWGGNTTCDMINGTDGTTTPPFMEKEDPIYFFVDDICRSIYAVYEMDMTVKRIPAWKFIIPAEAFQSPDTNPSNWCFCPDTTEPLCHVDGAVSISTCMAGAPVLVSSPHFLYGSDFYLNQTSGLSPPNKEEHETALVYEPNTGIGIMLNKRLQINFLMQNYPGIDFFEGITGDVVVPVVWLNESGTIGDSDADLLYSYLIVPADVVYILQIVLCCVGSVMVLVSIFYFMCYYTNKKKSKSSQQNMETKRDHSKSNGAYVNGHETAFSSTSSISEKN